MQSFKIAALLLLGYFWLVKEEEENLLILIATLATTEDSAGAVAKADPDTLMVAFFFQVQHKHLMVLNYGP